MSIQSATTAERTTATTDSWRGWLVIAIAIFSSLLAGKVLLIGHFGSSVPFWDSWDAEADALYRPYLSGSLTLSNLFIPQNEHRILFTKLVELALLELRGEWDPILQMLVDAAIHSALIAYITYTIGAALAVTERAWVALISTVVFLIPASWESLLWGFQLVYYLFMLFATLAIREFTRAKAFSPRWWLAAFWAVATYLSLASGALVAFAAGLVILAQLLSGGRQSNWREWLSLGVIVVTTVFMVRNVPVPPGDASAMIPGIPSFVLSVILLASFPFIPLIGIVCIHLPIMILAYDILTRKRPGNDVIWFLLGLAVWIAVQIVAISYGRGSGGVMASRYFDFLLVALPVNYVALRLDFEGAQADRKAMVATVVWALLIAAGLSWYTLTSFLPGMEARAAQGSVQHRNVTAYLQSGDIADLSNKGRLDIPYPSPTRLAGLLSDPDIRAILPDDIRPQNAKSADAKLHLHGWSSGAVALLERTVLLNAWLLVPISALLWLGGLRLMLRRDSSGARAGRG